MGAVAVGARTGTARVTADGPFAGPAWALPADVLAALPGRLAALDVPATSVALGGPGMPITAHAAGRRSPTSRSDGVVTPDGVFAAASLSKPVVATIAWTLHRTGTFDVNRPIVDYLADDVPLGPWAGEITAFDALRHASGLPNWRYEPGPLEPGFPPGSAWRYSGEGYVLVQRALEAATGIALERLARDVVFRPFGMVSTSFLARPDLEARTIPPHVPAEERFADYAALLAWKERAVVARATENGQDPADLTQERLRELDGEISMRAARMAGREFPDAATVPNFVSPNGAGSLRTTASDYLLLLRHWLADEELRRLAFASPVARDDGIEWGAGWGLDRADRAAFWHWGETLGVRTLAYADADVGDALVILTNGNAGMTVVDEVFRAATRSGSTVFDSLG
jgi:CubicO group peptidase (beta-lactamase class C family)